MTPEDRERLAKSRYQTIQLLRFTGIVVMVLGMWIWAGDILRIGGWPTLGAPLFVLGADGNTAELVNYRVSGNHMVVDRLFTSAELRLGRKKQQRVKIVREQPR